MPDLTFTLAATLLGIVLLTWIALAVTGMWRDGVLGCGHVEPLTPWPAAPAPLDLPQYVEKWVYWTLDKTGAPMCHFCDGPLGHPHVHLVRIPIPADVLACSEDIQNPPLCLIHDKFSRATGPCDKQESEPTDAP